MKSVQADISELHLFFLNTNVARFTLSLQQYFVYVIYCFLSLMQSVKMFLCMPLQVCYCNFLLNVILPVWPPSCLSRREQFSRKPTQFCPLEVCQMWYWRRYITPHHFHLGELLPVLRIFPHWFYALYCCTEDKASEYVKGQKWNAKLCAMDDS